jgi:plastocyanin
VTLSLVNDSALGHNIAIRGNGVDVAGPVVGTGSVSSVSATLAPGIYTFYCSVSGHAAAGMTGTLVVTLAGSTAPTGALPPPSGVKASSIGAAGLTLGWTASPDPLAISYEVQRGTTVLGTTPSTTFPVTTLACNTAYSFSVIALDTSGRRSIAATTTATTAACAPGPPPPPGGGTVLDLSTSGQIGFSTHALTAPAGQVTIRLTNVSGLDHNIALQGNGVALVGPVVTSGISSVTGTLAAGTYTFYCTLSGHAGAGMSGTLTVTGTGTTPPPTPLPPAAGAGLNLTVTGSGTFNTTTLTAPLGTVTIVLDNESSVARTLRVDGHGKDFTSAVVAPGARVSLTMTFDKRDDFDFSSPAGRSGGDGGMRGKLYIT